MKNYIKSGKLRDLEMREWQKARQHSRVSVSKRQRRQRSDTIHCCHRSHTRKPWTGKPWKTQLQF